MDIGYRRYVNEYINIIDNLSNIIDVALYNNMDENINKLINEILNYVHENFPSILITNNELIEKVKTIYIQKTEKFKKNVEFRKASIKYDLNGSFSITKIREYMEKGNKDLEMCFNSVSIGTNFSYCDTVLNISSDLSGTIQRNSNNNLIFAKRTKETQEYISKIVEKHYLKFMNQYGKELIEKGLSPLKILLEAIENYVEPTNEQIISEYNTHSLIA